MEDSISLKELYIAIKGRLKLIISVVLLSIIAGAIVTFFIMTPKYEASTQILVNQSQQNDNNSSSTTDIQSSRDLINTYNVIMTSPAILEPVIENSRFNGSVGELRSKINVSSEEESQVFTLTIEDTEPEMANELANTIAEVFEQRIPDIMNVDNVSILSQADLESSENPVSPQPMLNFAISLVLGIILSIIIALLMEFLDRSIKTEQDIEKQLGLPILGTVPTMKDVELNNSSNQTNSSKSMRSKNREERKTS